MRHGSASSLTINQARALIGVSGPLEPQALSSAFRAAVKAARPDMPGGDAERFRQVIDAYRLIQKQGGGRPALASPEAMSGARDGERSDVRPVVAISPMQALAGGKVEARIGARRLSVSVVPGVRTGDHLRLRGAGAVERLDEDADQAKAAGGDLYLTVLIRAEDGLAAVGDDLHMNWPVEPRVLRDGGRVEIETFAGTRSAWVTPGVTEPVRLRLRGLGLPARGRHGAGHLFVTLMASEDVPSAAEHLLSRFSRVWTPDRPSADLEVQRAA